MYFEVVKGMYLSGSGNGTEVSQPIEMGKDNAIKVQVRVIEGNLLGTLPLVVTAEGSNDLDTWLDLGYGFQHSFQEAPASAFIPLYSSEVGFRFLRLKFAPHSSAIALVSANIHTYTKS